MGGMVKKISTSDFVQSSRIKFVQLGAPGIGVAACETRKGFMMSY